MPYSIEAEESLLGAMLQNSKVVIPIVLSKINSKDFYSERNRLLYESVIEMHNRNIEVNGETALRYLKIRLRGERRRNERSRRFCRKKNI